MKGKYKTLLLLVFFVGTIILFNAVTYKLPTTSNPITALEAQILKGIIILIGVSVTIVPILVYKYESQLNAYLKKNKELPLNILLLCITIILCVGFFELVLFITDALQQKEHTIDEDLLSETVHHKNIPNKVAQSKNTEWDVTMSVYNRTI